VVQQRVFFSLPRRFFSSCACLGMGAWASKLSLWSSATHPRWCPPRQAIRRRNSRYPTRSARAGSRTGGASRAPHRRAGTRHGATRGIVGAGSRVPGSTGGGRCSSRELWKRCAWRWWQWQVSCEASDLRVRVGGASGMPRISGATGAPQSAPGGAARWWRRRHASFSAAAGRCSTMRGLTPPWPLSQ